MSPDDGAGDINIIPYYNIIPKFVLIDGRIPSGMRNLSSEIIMLPSYIPSGNIFPVMSASPSLDDEVVKSGMKIFPSGKLGCLFKKEYNL